MSMTPVTDERIENARKAVLEEGRTLGRDELVALIDAPLEELLALSGEVTRRFAPLDFNECAIMNTRNGGCTESCRWCAQSRRWNTGSEAMGPMATPEAALKAARATEAFSVPRFSLVCSGRKLGRREVREAARILEALKSGTGVEACASMGLLSYEDFVALKKAGLVRYHCNLETGPRFFPEVCDSHTFEDKVETLRAARRAGLDLCSGGLFGMGETMTDRIEMVLVLRELGVASIPLNFLIPIPGTPLENRPVMTADEMLRTIALFRLAVPAAQLRFAGGRLHFTDEDVLRAMKAGVNAAIVGDLLTTRGSRVGGERELARKAGYRTVETKTTGTSGTPVRRTVRVVPVGAAAGTGD